MVRAKSKTQLTSDVATAAPRELDPIALAEWKRLVPEMIKLGYTTVDRTCLMGYCVHYSLWRQAADHIREHGLMTTTPNGFQQPSPMHNILRGEAEILRKLMNELGITPSARRKNGMEIASSSTARDDEFLFGGVLS